MAAFEYKALGADGKRRLGSSTRTPRNRRFSTEEEGLFPTEVKEQQSGKATSGDGLNVEMISQSILSVFPVKNWLK